MEIGVLKDECVNQQNFANSYDTATDNSLCSTESESSNSSRKSCLSKRLVLEQLTSSDGESPSSNSTDGDTDGDSAHENFDKDFTTMGKNFYSDVSSLSVSKPKGSFASIASFDCLSTSTDGISTSSSSGDFPSSPGGNRPCLPREKEIPPVSTSSSGDNFGRWGWFDTETYDEKIQQGKTLRYNREKTKMLHS